MLKLRLDGGAQWIKPAGLYRSLHDSGGVGPLAGVDGIYCATYAGCQHVLTSHDWSLDMRLQRQRAARAEEPADGTEASKIPTLLAPENSPMRGVAVRALRAVLARLAGGGAAGIIAEVLDECEDEVAERGTIDAIERITDVVVHRVMCEVTGIDYRGNELLSRVMASFTQQADPGQQLTRKHAAEQRELSAAARAEASRILSGSRPSAVPDSLASQLASTYASAASLADRGDLLLLVWLAGTGTARSFLSAVLIGLAEEPESRQLISATPACAGPVVWELARLQSPVQAVNRVALHDTCLGAMPVTKGQVVLLLPGAANRDPAVYPDPDKFALRGGPRPLVFGSGVHTCLGATLGVAAAQQLAVQLVDRYPDFQLCRADYRNTIAMREASSAVITGMARRPVAGGVQ